MSWGAAATTQEDQAAEMAAHEAFATTVAAAGARIVDGDALVPPRTSIRITPGRDGGEPVLTDGLFPEVKEVVSGYDELEVSGRDHALAFAALCPTGGHVEEGLRHATFALAGGGRFALQAGIEGLHALAPSWELTDRAAVRVLYDGPSRSGPRGTRALARAGCGARPPNSGGDSPLKRSAVRRPPSAGRGCSAAAWATPAANTPIGGESVVNRTACVAGGPAFRRRTSPWGSRMCSSLCSDSWIVPAGVPDSSEQCAEER